MAINYVEKGYGLHEAIRAAGHWLAERGQNVWESSNDAAVQAIIDSYDELPYYKNTVRTRVKKTALAQINAIYPAIATFDDLELIRDLWLSIAQAARSPVTNFNNLLTIVSNARTVIQNINAANSKAAVDSAAAGW